MKLRHGILIFVLTLCLQQNTLASTRSPVGSEQSLLYWRYLCENLPTEEQVLKEENKIVGRKLSCPSLKWRVVTRYDEKLKQEWVQEVVENAK